MLATVKVIDKVSFTLFISFALITSSIFYFFSLDTTRIASDLMVLVLFLSVTLLLHIVMFVLYIRSKKMQLRLESFKLAVENSDNTVVITDANRIITYVNDTFVKTTGYTKESVIGKNPNILQSGYVDRSIYEELNGALKRGIKWRGEFINKTADGKIYYEKASISPILINGQIDGYLAVKLDVTDYINQQSKIDFVANHDRLTNLPNRYNFENTMSKQIAQDSLIEEKFAFIYLDLDGLKYVNDTLGHDLGDAVVVEVAQRLQNFLPKYCKLFHLGGDEFCIVADREQYSDIAHVCRQVLMLFSDPILVQEHSLKMGVSIGVTLYPEDAKNFTTLMSNADVAMSSVKQGSKNGFAFFTESLSEKAREKLKIEQALLNALERDDEMYMVFQPKFTAHKHTLFSAESLIRWNSKELGMISPDVFIPIAEGLGVIDTIGLFVFEKSCEGFMEIKKVHPQIQKVTVNVSVQQLDNDDFLHSLEEIMSSVGISATSIAIEITETSMMHNRTKYIDLFHKMRQMGMVVMIDDFGTGYSSMSYLTELPIDMLKIDKSFVDNVPFVEKSNTITKAIIGLGKTLKYGLVAEGVESIEQLEFLEQNGVEIIQGYYFCKPLTLEQILSTSFKSLEQTA